MLFKEIINAYSENDMKCLNSLWANAEILNVKAGGA
jgi:hypothetical protein